MSKNKNHKLKLLTIKSKTYELRSRHQLPFYLCKLIYELDGSEDVNYIKFLISMTEHCLRVNGYYKKFKFAEKETENMIKNGLKKMGSCIDVLA